jgi:hypothetical protein
MPEGVHHEHPEREHDDEQQPPEGAARPYASARPHSRSLLPAVRHPPDGIRAEAATGEGGGARVFARADGG